MFLLSSLKIKKVRKNFFVNLTSYVPFVCHAIKTIIVIPTAMPINAKTKNITYRFFKESDSVPIKNIIFQIFLNFTKIYVDLL